MQSEVERIAKRLGKSERRALSEAVVGVIPTYHRTNLSNGNKSRISITTLRSLTRKGLIETWPPKLTPLGLAVRDLLKQDEGL